MRRMIGGIGGEIVPPLGIFFRPHCWACPCTEFRRGIPLELAACRPWCFTLSRVIDCGGDVWSAFVGLGG